MLCNAKEYLEKQKTENILFQPMIPRGITR